MSALLLGILTTAMLTGNPIVDNELDDFSFDEPVQEAQTESIVENAKSKLYGYLVNFTQGSFRYNQQTWQKPTIGDALLLRLKGEMQPHKSMLFHGELSYGAQTGNTNLYAMYETYGLGTINQSDYVMFDFNQYLLIDHVWATINLGRFDLKFGKFPIGWGTGYMFNPTDRVAVPPFLDLVTEDTPGTMAILPSYAISKYLSVSAYIAFQDRTHKTYALADDARVMNMPYGVKVSGIAGGYDFSLSYFREILFYEIDPDTLQPLIDNDRYVRNHYVGFDFAGAIWNFGVYAEMAMLLPISQDGREFYWDTWRVADNLEIVVGFDYTFDALELDTKLEYFYQGTGQTDKAQYNIFRVLSGERLVQGQHYVVMYAEREFQYTYKLSVAAIMNCKDRSVVVYPMFSYLPFNNVEIAAGSFFFGGPQGSEFDGRYTSFGASAVDVTETFSVFARLKLSF